MADISAIKLPDGNTYDVKDTTKQPLLVSGTNIKTINNQSLLGSGNLTITASGTSAPTADTVAEFDSTAHMNSTDMSTQEINNFVNSLETYGENVVLRATPYFDLDITATSGDDKDIYDAVVALGWDSDVIV